MILANGDSWTGGLTYENRNDYWPYRLANSLQIPVVNLAYGGVSNQRIFRTTVERLLSIGPLPTHLIIGWSHINRYELPSSAGYYIRMSSSGCEEFIETGTKVPNIETVRKVFYNICYNEKLLTEGFTTQYLILQELCKSKNVRFLNFNSFHPKFWLLDDSRIDLSSWILPPDQNLSDFLIEKGFNTLETSAHTEVAGQHYWANYIRQYL